MKLYILAVAFLIASCRLSAADTRVFDFGMPDSPVQAGAVGVSPDTAYSAARSFGWVGGDPVEARDRGLTDKLRRDFVYGRGSSEFRVDLPDGYYRVTVLTGDSDVGNHVLAVEAQGQPVTGGLHPAGGEICEYSFTTKVTGGKLDLRFSSPERNWVLNGLVIAESQRPDEPAAQKTTPLIPKSPRLTPAPHHDRLHVIKKPDYSAISYPTARDFMRILERFPMYSERGWHADYLGDPAVGYFGDFNHSEMGLRAMGNYIFVTALLATDPNYDPKPSGISKATLLKRAHACLAYMTRAHVTGDIECGDGVKWGKEWQSSWWAARMAAGARLLWPTLTAQERAGVERVLVCEADRHLTRVPPSGMTSDTKAEENAWDSEALAWAIGMFPKHPHALAWRTKLTEFYMNTLSAPQDKTDTDLVDGKPVKDWIVSANIHDDFTIENHGAYHFCYMACPLHSLSWGYEGLIGGGQGTPDALFHHYQDVWRWIKRSYVGEGQFAYLSGKDWPRYAYGLSFVLPATVLAELKFGDSDARRLEKDRIALLEREQLLNADGSFYGGRFTRNILAGRQAEYETDTYANIALCYLLHHNANSPAPTDPDKLRARLAGNWSSPGSGWAFGRSAKLFTSFSWRHLSGIKPVGLFIPAGCGDMAEWMPDQLVGQFDVEGVDPRKTTCQHAEAVTKAGFSTTGEITYCDVSGAPLVRQQISFTAFAKEGMAVVMERTVAAAAVKVKSSQGLNLALANDIFNGSVRKITFGGGKSVLELAGAKNLGTVEAAKPEANAVNVTARPVPAQCLTIDNRLGIVQFQGDLPQGDGFTIHDYSGRNAPWGSLQYDVISGQDTGERSLNAGDPIIETAYVLVAGNAEATDWLRMGSVTRAVSGEPAVRYALVPGRPDSPYLIVADLDGIARTVRIPLLDRYAKTVSLTGFETQVIELEPKR